MGFLHVYVALRSSVFVPFEGDGQWVHLPEPMQWCTFPSVSSCRPIRIQADQLFQSPSGPWSDWNTILCVSCAVFFYDTMNKPSCYAGREAGDVWCLPPVWNLRAVIWFHFAVSSLVLLPSPVTLSVLLFSACWPFLLNFFQKILQYFSLRDRLFCMAPV